MLVHYPRFPGQRIMIIGRNGGAFSPLSLAPLAWWRLNDGSGTTAVDSSGNGYDLTLSNTPTWIAGQIGGGLNFAAASSEKGETAAAGLQTSLEGLSAFTIAAWFRAAADLTTSAAFAIRNGVDSGALFALYPYDDDPAPGPRVFFNGNNVMKGSAVTHDTWHHFAIVQRSATDRELFVDNVSQDTDNTSISLSATISHVTVGAWNGGQFFNGDVDEVLIFGRALLAGELQQIYQWTGP